MDSFLAALLAAARERFGPERTEQLTPSLEEAAADLRELHQFRLEPEDEL